MKRSILIAAAFVIISTPVWAQFYKNMTFSERKEVAEAYYLAGERYKAVGKTKKGSDFIAMAYRIDPDLQPDSIQKQSTLYKRETKIIGEWQPSYRPVPEGVTAANAIKYQFSKFLRGFLTEDTTLMLQTIDSRVYIPGIKKGMPKPEVEARIQYLFLSEPISTTPPSQILDMRSIKVAPVNKSIWVASIRLADNPNIDKGKYPLPNQDIQKFYFRLVGANWLIFAFGDLPPGVAEIVSPEETIKDTFVACLQDFVNKDAEAASRFFTDPFYNIPFGKDVSRDELIQTFKGYFDEYDFSRLAEQKVTFKIEESKAVTHPGGKTYKVQISFANPDKMDLPFWQVFSGYYVVFDTRAEAWKIYAIF